MSEPLGGERLSTQTRGPVICVEGPSAVGKTTLVSALASECGAVVVPELKLADVPRIADSGQWFAEQHSALWQVARIYAASGSLVLLDGDPLKALWFNWVYAGDGWPTVKFIAPYYRSQLRDNAIGFPDLYVILETTEADLRRRRAEDPTRTRRNFEQHLRLVEPQRRYFAALQSLDPRRVIFADSSHPRDLVDKISPVVGQLQPSDTDDRWLLDQMIAWVSSNAPVLSST